MPGGITTYGSGALLAAAHGLAPVLAQYYVALCLREPGVDVDGTALAAYEPPAGSGYARQLLAVNGTNFATDGQYLVSQVDVPFGSASAAWGLPTHYGLCTALTGGDLYIWGRLGDTYRIDAGGAATIPAGGIALALSTLDAPIVP